MACTASLSTSFSHTIIQQDVEDHQTESPDTYYAYCAQAWDEIATTEASSLNDEIRTIKDEFRAISTYLSKLDKRSKPILRVFFRGPRAGTWSGRWDELRGKFDDSLDESRTSALEASALLKQFVAIIENNAFVESGSLNALKKELMEFTKLLGHKRDVAASMRKKFERISDDIKEFKDELQQRFESDKMPSQELHDNLAKTLNEISILEDRLATLNAKISELVGTGLSSLSIGATSAGCLLIKLLPTAASKAVGIILEHIPQSNDARKLRMDAELLRANIKEKRRHVKRMKKDYDKGLYHLHEMERRVTAVGRLADSVDAVSGIWDTIWIDITQLRASLETVTCGENDTEFFSEKLSITRAVYKKLVEALFQYASALGGCGGRR